MPTTTIYLRLEESVGNEYLFACPPAHKPMTAARQQLASALVKSYPLGLEIPPADRSKEFGPCDLDDLNRRITSVAARHACRVRRVSKTVWRVTQTREARQSFTFPSGAFSSCAQTKWGPTDFYDDTRSHILSAMRSSLDFETPWLFSKKEVLSSRITRVKGTTTVEVAVSDDFDTPGMGEASKRLRSDLNDDQLLLQLQKLGDEAWRVAEDDRRGNATYVGWSVGPDDGRGAWVNTYLVGVAGLDFPPGDNYRRWGWQEAEDGEELPPAEDIPNDIAQELAEKMENFAESPIVHRGFRATIWG